MFPWPLLGGWGWGGVGGSSGAPAPVVWIASAAATLWSPSYTPGTSTGIGWRLIPTTTCEVGIAHATFTSHEAGAQRGRRVFPQSLSSGRAAVSSDYICALDTDTVLPLDGPETEQLT